VRRVCIRGGGPAGCSAAIAALREGAEVQLIEKAHFPRHKVCGEFLSPGIETVLQETGLWSGFQALRPAHIRRMLIHAGRTEKTARLPEKSYGLSRYAFDSWLWNTALAAGAYPIHDGIPNVITTGRRSISRRGGRLFGFKAHFTGPADDAVELYFAGGLYVGLNCVENGFTNVCGLAPEEDLRRWGFDVDVLIRRDGALRNRLALLTRSWDWIFTGPLRFGRQMYEHDAAYVAGDALSFVDPFTGSGILCAMLTGSLAGHAAAKGISRDEYVKQCAKLLTHPFRFSSLLRGIAATPAAGPLLRIVPPGLLFRWTRP
jgi:menaquinone-9 beta-reductase